ncbi:MAG: phosphatase PAP2 family protein [Deltaproteobacteria bacterium]|nr:phosphatase PAP2 family protein [Deltaproteobacteria bacterium]
MVLALLASTSGWARAQSTEQTPVTESFADASPADPDLEWWPWLVSVPLAAMALTIDVTVPSDSPRWTPNGPIDRGFESWIRPTIDGRRRAAHASDFFLFAAAAAPVADAISWHAKGTRHSRVTYRLLTADALAFSFQALVTVSLKHAVRRPRPYVEPCEADPTHDPGCDSGSRYQSFTSGHTSASFTGAALVCAHQRLRGWSVIGYVECAGALALASFASTLRIVSERHYASDVIGGAIIGFISGYLLPLLLYPRALPPRRIAPRAW